MMVVVIYSFNRRHVCCQIHPYVLNIYPCLPRRAANTNMWVLGDHHVPVKKRRRIYYFGRFMNVPMMFDNCQCSDTFSVTHSNLMYFISLITLNVHKKKQKTNESIHHHVIYTCAMSQTLCEVQKLSKYVCTTHLKSSHEHDPRQTKSFCSLHS
jgi:hypothetical protein